VCFEDPRCRNINRLFAQGFNPNRHTTSEGIRIARRWPLDRHFFAYYRFLPRGPLLRSHNTKSLGPLYLSNEKFVNQNQFSLSNFGSVSFVSTTNSTGFQHYRGSYDDKHHLTLNPDVPRTFEHPFTISTKPKLQAGHRYAFGLAEGQGIGWWCWGTKAEVLREKIEPRPVSETRRIVFEPVAPVEFVVETNDTEPKLDNEN